MAANTHGLTELGYTILLDRYAQKDKDRNNIAVGDIVVAIIRGSGKDTYQRREIARVSRLFESNSRKYAEILLLFSQETIELPLDHLDKPLELTPEQVQKRVAKGAASIEDESIRQKIQSDFEWALSDFKFIPGGRILAAAGTDQELTYMNCFVIPSPHDSRGGIMKSLTQMTEIMSRGGGVGMNLSSLRPNRAYVKGVNGRSSGSVSWGSLFSYVTGLIEQGGCFAGDTRVPTDKGLLRIDEIVKRHKNGERFYTKTHTGWKKITDVFENGVQPLIEIELRRGYTVRVTPNHPMAYLDNGEIAFIPAEKVSLSDQLLTLIPKYAEMNTNYVKLEPLEDEGFGNTALEHPLPEELDEDLAYLLGYSYGDGYVFYKNDTARYLSFSLATDYPQIKDRLIAISKDLFDYDMCVETCSGNWENAKIFSVKIMEWLKKNGILKQKSENIRVPEVIFKSPMSVQASFIAGYFDADGSITKTKKMIRFHSVNRDMLSDIQIMLASFGILSNMKVEDRSELGWQDIRNLGVTGTKFKQRFIDLIPSEKVKLLGKKVVGKRDMYNSYSSEIISGLERKHTKGIYDGVSTSISFNQVQKIQEKLLLDKKSPDQNLAVYSHLSSLSNLMPDSVISINRVLSEETYDITVEDEHMLSGNGAYSSNSRRGALLLMMDDWHPDVFEYINSKREAGKVTNANISVNFSDAFMEALKNDGDWELKFPDTSDPDYDTLWDGRLDRWIAAGKPVNVYQVVKASEIWNAVIESAWASAEPGLWFGDRANYWSNSRFYDEGYLISTNPCVTGDTLVSTKNGYIKAKDLVVGTEIMTPGGFKPIKKVYNNGVKRIYRVNFSDGDFLEGTSDHKIRVIRGQKYEWVAIADLSPNDKVLVMPNTNGFAKTQRLPEEAIQYMNKWNDGSKNVRFSDFYDETIGFFVGATLGDGTFRVTKTRNSQTYHLSIPFGKNEGEWESVFYDRIEKANIHYNREVLSKEVAIKASETPVLHTSIKTSMYKLATFMSKIGLEPNVKAPNKKLPDNMFNGSRDFLKGVLDGLFSTGGSITLKSDTPMLRLSTTSIQLARQVRMILLQFGIQSRIYRSERISGRMYDGRDMTGTGEIYNLVVMNSGIKAFYSEIGLSHPDKMERLKIAANEYHFIGNAWTTKVVSVEDTGRDEEVFDLYEPDHTTWVTNGYVSFDCGEISLPSFGACNLGSINLSKMYDPHTKRIDFDKIYKTATIAARFLDNILSITPYPIPETENQQLLERRVGIGTMGIAELLVKIGVQYGSDEGQRVAEQVFKTVTLAAYAESARLAKEKGVFPRYSDDMLDRPFMRKIMDAAPMMDDDGEKITFEEYVSRYGMRNITLVTQPPTGCVVPDTLIHTNNGVSRISDLGDINGEKWQKKSDLQVMTDDGLKTASHFFVNGEKETIKLKTKRGYSIEATPNHRIRIIDEYGQYQWSRMDEIRENDTVVLMRDTILDSDPVLLENNFGQDHSHSKVLSLPEKMTEELAELIGLYMGDGYLKRRLGLRIVVANTDPDVLDRVMYLSKSIFGVQATVEDSVGCKIVSIHGYSIYRYFVGNGFAKEKGNHGEGAASAFIPSAILKSGRRCISAFLRGLFEADGSSTRGVVTLCTVSEILANQVMPILLGLGIASSLRVNKKDSNSFGKRDIFEIRLINIEETKRFLSQIGFISKRKTNQIVLDVKSSRGDNITNKSIIDQFYAQSSGLPNDIRQKINGRKMNGSLNSQFVREIIGEAPSLTKTALGDLINKGAFFDTVSFIGHGVSETFDLSVPENNTYIANGFVSHNTTGSLANTSTGIEPFFSWKFYRKGRLGIFEENVQVVQDWLNENPDKTIDDLPFYFVTAMDLTPEEHVKILATAQKWNDSSISKTCNVPNEYTVEEVGELYRLMYDLGAKGGTIYRDGSRDEQVLNLTREQAEKGNQKKDEVKSESVVSPVVSSVVPQTETVVEQPEPVLVPTPHGKVSRPKILSGKTFMKQTDWGTFFVTVNELENGDPYEVFVTIGKSGSDVQAFCEAMGRLISLALRYGNGNRKQILAKAVEQIRYIGGGQPSGFGPNKIFSIPDAVAKIIEDYYINGQNALEGIEIKIHETNAEVEDTPAPIKIKRSPKRDVCPECGNMTLVREEGCYKCQSCGYSKC